MAAETERNCQLGQCDSYVTLGQPITDRVGVATVTWRVDIMIQIFQQRNKGQQSGHSALVSFEMTNEEEKPNDSCMFYALLYTNNGLGKTSIQQQVVHGHAVVQCFE